MNKEHPSSPLKGTFQKINIGTIVPLRIIEIKAIAFDEDSERSSLGVFFQTTLSILTLPFQEFYIQKYYNASKQHPTNNL